MKLGRNQPCWCGSGKKYKKCHLNREKQEEIQPWEAEQFLKKAFGSKYCSVPDTLKYECDGNIVKAHSVSKSMNLKKIERNGHVYAFIPSIKNLIENHGVLQPKLYGINKASTFTGFCAYHDKEIFSPIENQDFIGSKEQCFLLAYRTLSREYFTKKSAEKSMDFMKQLDRGKNLFDQLYMQSMISEQARATEVGARDVTIYKKKYDTILTTKNFSDINSYILNFRKTPSVLCSAANFPQFDFEGNRLQNLSDLKTTPDFITYSTIATKNGGAVIFTWLEDTDYKGNCEKFIHSLNKIKPKDITSSLIRFFFEFCENVFMEPTWWESLEKDKQSTLIKRLAIASSIMEKRSAKCLCSDNLTFDNWEFINTITI